MAENDPPREGLSFDTGFKELEVVVFLGEFKIIGMAHFGVGHRSSSRRSSDYLRQFNESRLTLSNVRVYSKASQELIETTPFVIVNMDKVDMIYAREEGGSGEPN
jgi:hypothetical protein